MDERSVAVELALDGDEDGSEAEERFPSLREEVAVRGGVSLDPSEKGRYGARFYVTADEPGTAVEEGVAVMQEAVQAAGLPEGRVVDVEAPTLDELHQQGDRSELPELVDISGLSQMLGVNRHLSPIVVRSKGFPKPVAELNGGPVWVLEQVERFLSSTAANQDPEEEAQEARDPSQGRSA